MIEIKPQQTEETPINNSPAVGDGGGELVEAPQEMLEYFNIKPEDNISKEDKERLTSIYITSKEMFPTGSIGEIMRFVKAVENANPVYAGSETDRLFNMYKNFKLGKVYG